MKNIINIVNFIRGSEPRDPELDLVEPVENQIRLLKEHRLKGTFLMQYDAMLRDDLVCLIQPLDDAQFEKGVWLEMSRPLTDRLGLPWYGREGFDWDWHAQVDYTFSYDVEDRFRIVDEVFRLFRELFGFYPESVGSWMLDAPTLKYLSDKYHVKAACICKDQWGTDGYTLWGGYWNQAYYPSVNNAFCPAQTEECQIGLPVFRMLGSDPVTQYDLGLSIDDGAAAIQKVASLEPVYGCAGSDPDWVDWFLRQNFREEGLGFGYAQAGQENPFGWAAMKHGLTIQFARFEELQKAGTLTVEKLCESGAWFKNAYRTTPAASVAALEERAPAEAASVWYDCAFYRVNLYRSKDGVRIRDLFLFDERQKENYCAKRCETEYLVYENLPVIDGNRMSGSGILAGGWLVRDGKRAQTSPFTVKYEESSLTVSFGGGSITAAEDGITVTGGYGLRLEWDEHRCALEKIEGNTLRMRYHGVPYALCVKTGTVRNDGFPVLEPQNGILRIQAETR